MSEGIFEFGYQPDRKEIAIGGRLVARSIYRGGWRWAAWGFGAAEGAAFAALGGLLSYFILAIWGETPTSAFLVWWSLWMLFACGGMLLGTVIRNRSCQIYLLRTLPKAFRVRLSPEGIEFRSAHSSNRTGWADVDEIVHGKGMTVLVTDTSGFVLQDRLVAQAGDPTAIARAISDWYAAARRGAK